MSQGQPSANGQPKTRSPFVRVPPVSPCTNGSNMASSCSSAMPIPVSSTAMHTQGAFPRAGPPKQGPGEVGEHPDAPAGLRELDRVREDVNQDLPYPIVIADE